MTCCNILSKSCHLSGFDSVILPTPELLSSCCEAGFAQKCKKNKMTGVQAGQVAIHGWARSKASKSCRCPARVCLPWLCEATADKLMEMLVAGATLDDLKPKKAELFAAAG